MPATFKTSVQSLKKKAQQLSSLKQDSLKSGGPVPAPPHYEKNLQPKISITESVGPSPL